MSAVAYSANPVRDAERFFDAVDEQQLQLRRAEACLRGDFLRAAAIGEMNNVASFAPYRTEWRDGIQMRRHPTIGEVMAESLDYPEGPCTDDVLGFLARQADAGNAEALRLVVRMAEKWAEMAVTE